MTRTCVCGRAITPSPRERNPRKWCSEACRVWAHRHPGQRRRISSCGVCGSGLPSKRWRYCSADCRGYATRDRLGRCRAELVGNVVGDPVYLNQIAVRDGNTCGICGEPVDLALGWPDLESATIDHIVAISAGGAHDPSNCQLAHWICNIAKAEREEIDGAPWWMAANLPPDAKRCDHCLADIRHLVPSARFCSRACKTAAHRAAAPLVEHTCIGCSQIFTARRTRRFCTRGCEHAWKRRAYAGRPIRAGVQVAT